jgi:hypothetical protein
MLLVKKEFLIYRIIGLKRIWTHQRSKENQSKFYKNKLEIFY